MSSARGQTLIHKCLVGLLLSPCCTAFAFATDTDAWLVHLIDTVSASIPPTDNLAGRPDLFVSEDICCSVNVGPPQEDRAELEVYVDWYLAAEQVAPENAEKPEAAAAGADVQRGRLLYETHCIVCHTTQAHWREKHIVRSWTDLLYQVTRWQKNAGQDWSSEEINDVAAYLNETFYKMP